MLDLLLTIAHHILVFTLIAMLAAEIAAIRPNMRADQIDHLAKLDRAYGIVAMLVILAGGSRVIWGAKGPDAFLQNPWFWAKMATFLLIALVSVRPTMSIRRWNIAVRSNQTVSPGEAEITPVRNFMLLQAALVPLLLIFAAMMVRFGSF